MYRQEVLTSTRLVNATEPPRIDCLSLGEFDKEEANTVSDHPPFVRCERAGGDALAQPKDRPVLMRLDGARAGGMVSLVHLPATIGRHPTCEILVNDPGVSRRHSTILTIGNSLVIEDLGSCNGTFVEGERISRAELTDGCLVQIGVHVEFRYALMEERLEQLLGELHRSSTRDALTGAYNRRHFDDWLLTEVAFARRHSTDVSLVIVDIDFFKQVNDSHGHAAGDAVLRHVALTLQRQLRVEDVLSRVGGEEFAVILHGIGNGGAARLGERLRTTVAQTPTVTQGISIPITVSVGCAALSELEPADVPTLFAVADTRLYSAKRQGRNRVVSA